MFHRPLPPSLALPLWQSPEWADTLRSLGQDAEVEQLGRAGQAMVITRFGKLRFTSRGPVWAFDVPDEDKVAALRDARLHLVNAASDAHAIMRRAGYFRAFAARQVAMLRIAASFEAQLSQAHQKWRHAVRQAQARQIEVTQETYFQTRHDWIFTNDQAQQKAKGFRNLPATLIRTFATLHPRRVHITQAWIKGQPIAAMMYLVHGAIATYHLGWTSDHGREANAHHLMLLQAAQHLKKRGVEQIDLGLYDPQGNAGLARFKRRAGSDIQTLGGTWIKRPFA